MLVDHYNRYCSFNDYLCLPLLHATVGAASGPYSLKSAHFLGALTCLHYGAHHSNSKFTAHSSQHLWYRPRSAQSVPKFASLQHLVEVPLNLRYHTMVMKMNMSSPTLDNISAGSTTATSSMNAMTGMPSTFSSSTRVTLWFTTWTTTTPATYFLTILFLFCLGMLNRFLGAFRSQLEQTWQVQSNFGSKEVHAGNTEKASLGQLRGHVRQWSRGIRPAMVRLEEPDGQETEPLSPAAYSKQPEEGSGVKNNFRSRKFWVANAPWSIKKDGISAGLEFVRALIGYVLLVLWDNTP